MHALRFAQLAGDAGSVQFLYSSRNCYSTKVSSCSRPFSSCHNSLWEALSVKREQLRGTRGTVQRRFFQWRAAASRKRLGADIPLSRTNIDRFTHVGTEVEEIVHTKLETNEDIGISAMYQWGAICKTDFLSYITKFISEVCNSQNQIVIGDYNIDLWDLDVVSQQFLTKFLENGYIPCFKKITIPVNSGMGGTRIDDMFYKSNVTNYKAFKTSISAQR